MNACARRRGGRHQRAGSMRRSGVRRQDGEPKQEFVYEAPGSAVRVRMDFGVVDRLASEALRGLGALPRRGMEVGGLLLGSAGQAGRVVEVAIGDFVAFPCEHLYGPSFQLSPRDREAFAELAASWAAAPGRPLYPVGFFRSHTRGGLELTPEDVEVLDAWLPQPHAVCLLIRPNATGPGEAALFFRDQGVFRPGPPSATFPFRRRELGGGAPPRRAPSAETRPAAEEPPRREPARVETWIHSPAPQPRWFLSSGGWLLVLALLAFLLVGVVIGVQLAGVLRPPSAPAASGDPFALGLSAVQVGGAIHLRWNPQAPALAACRSASLVIRDGPNTRIIDLRREDLARGALIYQHSSPAVAFRMEAILSPANTVSESVDLRLMPPAASPGAAGPDPLK